MSPEPADHRTAQRALGDYIRDPASAAAPAGIEERRLKIYRELFFNNIESMLAGNFPVIRRILADAPSGDAWPVLVRDFYREHPSRTPLFTELAREFLRYLEHRADADRGDPPWLAELAHYEWAELALQISEARVDDVAHDPDGDPGSGPGQVLLAGRPLVSPLAWPFAYAWPVHRLGPEYQPETAPATPTCLLLQRDAAGKVHFQELSALTFRLLQRLDQHPGLSGRAQLQALASEAGASDIDAFVEQGAVMLQQLHSTGVICGTRLAAERELPLAPSPPGSGLGCGYDGAAEGKPLWAPNSRTHQLPNTSGTSPSSTPPHPHPPPD